MCVCVCAWGGGGGGGVHIWIHVHVHIHSTFGRLKSPKKSFAKMKREGGLRPLSFQPYTLGQATCFLQAKCHEVRVDADGLY